IDGGRGADKLDGGAGYDTVTFAGAGQAVQVDLSTGKSSENDTLQGFEKLVGSRFDDTLTGDGGANRLEGGAGADVLVGGAGDDELEGGQGADTLTGGAGADKFEYVAGRGA